MNKLFELQMDNAAEQSRTSQIAMNAITDLHEGTPLSELDTVALEALIDWLSAERQDRDHRLAIPDIPF